MLPSHEAWWKTVVAELDGSAPEVRAGLHAAAEACGFRSRGMRNDMESFVRSELLLLIPTRYEWCIDVIGNDNRRSEFGIRVGFAPGIGYYGTIALMFAAAIIAGMEVLSYPEFELTLLVVMAALMIMPLAQSIILRLRGLHFEQRLWRAMAGLGPWSNARIVRRNMNYAYGEDRVVACNDLSAEAVARETAKRR